MLAVTIHRSSHIAIVASILTRNSSGEVPEGLSEIYDRIDKGERLSVRYIEQCLGPPSSVDRIDAQRESRCYRGAGDPRVLDVVVETRSQRAIKALIVIPYGAY